MLLTHWLDLQGCQPVTPLPKFFASMSVLSFWCQLKCHLLREALPDHLCYSPPSLLLSLTLLYFLSFTKMVLQNVSCKKTGSLSVVFTPDIGSGLRDICRMSE